LFTIKGLIRAGSVAALGVSALLLAAPSAWSQRPDSTNDARDDVNAATKSNQGAAGDGSAEFIDPQHEEALRHARHEAELIKTQGDVRRAHVRVAEARLRQARDELSSLQRQGNKGAGDEDRMKAAQDEIELREAELDLARAEAREPDLIHEVARRRVADLEQFGRQGAMGGGMMGMGHPGMEMEGTMEHPGMMGMFHHPHPMWMMRDTQIETNLKVLRTAVERLEKEVDGLLDGSIKPGSIKDASSSATTAGAKTDGARP